MSKKAKEIKPMKDRFLTGRREDFSYITFALYFVLFFLSALLIFVYFVGMCQVSGSSMTPTLTDNERLLMWNYPHSYKVGDIVAVAVEGEDGLLIKRVVAVGGDEIVFARNSEDENLVDLWRKDKETGRFVLQKEDYIESEMKFSKFNQSHFKIVASVSEESLENNKITVDEGTLLLLGDNRNDSLDSRAFGLVPSKNVRGKMFYALEKGSILERLLLLIYTDGNSVRPE